MKNHQVKRLFIFFLIFLPLQYALVGIIGDRSSEPWPAFVFPGFKNVYVYEDGYEISNSKFEIHQQGTSEVILLKPQELFPEIPNSQISGFMRTHFSSEKNTGSFDNETKNWLMNHAKIHAGKTITDVQVVWMNKYYSKSGSGDEAREDSTAETMRFSILTVTGDSEDE